MDNQTDVSLNTPARRLPVWAVAAAFVLLIAFLALIGIGLKRAQSGPISVGQTVPFFTMTTFDGQTIDTADHAGKVIVINFWASWCKPCEQEAADLEKAYQVYKPDGDVVFFGIDYVDTEPEALGYLQKFGVTFPNSPDLGTKVSQMFRIQGVPETYIVNRSGKLAYVKKGPFMALDEITSIIDGLR